MPLPSMGRGTRVYPQGMKMHAGEECRNKVKGKTLLPPPTVSPRGIYRLYQEARTTALLFIQGIYKCLQKWSNRLQRPFKTFLKTPAIT
jgi:hypothetical protein